MYPLLPAETMHLALVVNALGMLVIAALYLRRRTLPLMAYLAWGLLALLLPMVGPFLVILSHPGQSTRTNWGKRRIARLIQ